MTLDISKRPIVVGSTITNGSSCIRVTARDARDPKWKTSGWRGVNIGLEAFGGNVGTTSFVPDYLLGSWRHVPFEWTPVIGGGLEERYVWTPDYRRLQREVRPVVVTDESGAVVAEVGDFDLVQRQDFDIRGDW